MPFDSVEEALAHSGCDYIRFSKTIALLREAILQNESVEAAAITTVGTPRSTNDPIGVCVVTDRQILAAYKPSALARRELIKRDWQGLSGPVSAQSAGAPAIAVRHNDGDIFLACERENVRQALTDAMHELDLIPLREFARRSDVQAWLEKLGPQDVSHIRTAYGAGVVVKNLPPDERVWGVMPARFLECPGVLFVTASRLFFVPNTRNGSLGMLFNAWPGGLHTISCDLGDGWARATFHIADPDRVAAGAGMKEFGVGQGHDQPIQMELGIDTPSQALEAYEGIFDQFLGMPPSPK